MHDVNSLFCLLEWLDHFASAVKETDSDWFSQALECTHTCITAGPLANIDAAFFARKAMESAAVASLRELAVNKLNDGLGSPRILLNLVCVAMAAFDLSPFTLPLPELQAFVDTLAHLYEGRAGRHAVMYTA